MSDAFDSREFIRQWKDKEEWLFALAVAATGLERENNLDAAAEGEISEALKEFNISEKDLRGYMKKNRREILRFLDSSRQ